MRFKNSTTATLMLIFDVYYLVVSAMARNTNVPPQIGNSIKTESIKF